MKNVGEKHAILIGEPPAIDQRPPPHVAGARPKNGRKATWEENITHSHIPEKINPGVDQAVMRTCAV